MIKKEALGGLLTLLAAAMGQGVEHRYSEHLDSKMSLPLAPSPRPAPLFSFAPFPPFSSFFRADPRPTSFPPRRLKCVVVVDEHYSLQRVSPASVFYYS